MGNNGGSVKILKEKKRRAITYILWWDLGKIWMTGYDKEWSIASQIRDLISSLVCQGHNGERR